MKNSANRTRAAPLEEKTGGGGKLELSGVKGAWRASVYLIERDCLSVGSTRVEMRWCPLVFRVLPWI